MSPQIFLSYKTHDSHVARLVADWLRHNGIDVWFAEYRILLHGRDDPSIDRALESHINSSSHAILFTNERYAESDWCRRELELIGPHLPPRNVLIVGLPDHPPQLDEAYGLSKEIRRVSLSPSAPVDLVLLEREMRALGWPLPGRMRGIEKLPVQPATPFPLPFLDLRLDLHDWEPLRTEEHAHGECLMRDAYFRRDLNGPLQLCVTSTKYPEALGKLELPQDADDRALYEHALTLAGTYGDSLQAACGRSVDITGVHLVFLGERSHFAMSYHLDDPERGRLAARKYALLVHDEAHFQGVYEIVFTFNTFGSSERLDALSPYFDYVVTCFVPLRGTLAGIEGPMHEVSFSQEWTDETHPLLKHLLHSPMYDAARAVVFSGVPPARAGRSKKRQEPSKRWWQFWKPGAQGRGGGPGPPKAVEPAAPRKDGPRSRPCDLRDPLLQRYLDAFRSHLPSSGRLSLESSFTPDHKNDPPPPTAKLMPTADAPNLYLRFAVQLDLAGLDHHDAELIARGWVNATIGAACEAFAGSGNAKGFDFAFELSGLSDRALRLGDTFVTTPRWRIRWNKNWWDPIQAIATDHLAETAATSPNTPTHVWVVVGTPVVDVARFALDPTGNTLYDYASAMEALRLGYEEMLRGKTFSI